MSESFAGVTLLAFGAGAPDVFASLSASEGGEGEGILMGISVLLGSSMFILAIVTSLVILYSPSDIKLNQVFFTRDACFLLMAQLLLLYALVVKECFDLTISFTFVLMYAAYVITVII